MTTMPWNISAQSNIIPIKFQEEAYLFIPFDEDYYQAMAKVIDKRFANWQGQRFR